MDRAVIFFIHGLYGFFFSRLNIPLRRYHLAAGGLHVLILILLWSTNIFVSDQFVARRFLILEKPFVEADLGPLGPVFMLYALGASINAIRIWIVKGKEREMHSRAYVWGVSFWILLGAHDAACAVGFPSFQYVMEYGFLGFSAGLFYTLFSDYLRTMDALGQSNVILRKEIESRERVEEELRETQAFLMSILDNSPSLIYVNTPDNRYRMVNKAWERFVGKTQDEVKGRRIEEIFSAGTAREFIAVNQKVIETGSPVVAEESVTRLDGNVFFHTVKYPIREASGRIDSIGGISVDITNSKRVESALKESENRLKIAQNIAKIGNWSWDITSGKAEWSDQVYDIFKAPQEAPSYEFVKSFVHPDDLDFWQNTVQKAIEENKPFSLDYRAVRSDGETIWLHNETHTVFNEQGKLTGYEGTVQDITEQKQAFDRIDRQNKELGILNNITTSVSGTLDINEIMELALDKVLKIAGLETGSIYLMDHQAEELILAGYCGASEAFAQQVETFKLGESLTGRVALTGEPIVEPDITKDSRVTTALISEAGIQSFAAIPMESKKKVQGVLCIASHRHHEFGNEEIQLYTSIANYIGVAIENARLYEERKLAAEELKKSEALHKEAQRVAHIGHWELDPDIGTPVWSEEIFRIFGLEPDKGEPSFTNHETYVHPEDWPILDKAVRKAGSEGTPFDLVFRIVKADGEIGWMHAIGTTSMDEEGNVTKLFGTAQDITELKKTEQAMHEKTLQAQRLADELELIMDSVPGLIFFKDMENRIIRANKFLAEAHQMTKEQLKGTSCFELFPREMAQAYFDDDMEVIRSRRPKLNIEEPWETAYGTRWINTSKIPYLNERGEVAGVIGLSLDITERKRAEDALRESEEKYRSLVESTEDSIYLVDRNCAYLFMNKSHLSRFGVKANEVLGRRYDHFHSKDETKEFKERVNEVIKTGESSRYVYQSDRAGGYYLRTLSPVRDVEGSIAAVTVISKDITEIIRAEEDLRQANEKLSREHYQRKVLSKRLIDLLEKDRRQVAMELHDHIGQILTSLKIDIEMLHRKLEPENRALEAQITVAQERTIQALRDIKNISQGLRPSMLDKLGLVPSLRELFNQIQKQTDIEIRFFSRNVPKRFAPEKELAVFRIAQEATTNTIKYAGAKQVFVNLVKKGEGLSLSVEDDGIGFDPKRVMQPAGEGPPLGLLVMRERAEQLGGEFILESQAGKGTHILVEIPV